MADVYPNAGILAAQIAGESIEMDELAERTAALARGFAAQHNDSGTFEDSIEVVSVRGPRGVRDRAVISTDPLAVPKDLGHAVVRDGEVVGYAKGLHTFEKAVAATPRVG